jgi:hypothetical protein
MVAEKVAENSSDEEENNHFPSDFTRANYTKYLLPLIIYLSIALIIFWPVTLNITSIMATGGPGISRAGTGDFFQNLWSMWWVNYAIFNLHTSPYYTHLLFYPVGANLATETLSPLAFLFSYPFQAVNLGFAFNILLFFDFALSGLFMFLLADYVVKNKYAAFIAGVLFTFSSFHMTHALFGQSNWVSIEFLPLFILFFLFMVKDKKPLSILGTSVSFVFLVFFGDPEQGILALLFVALMLLIKLISSEGRKEILNKKFFVSVFSAAILIFILGSPFFVPIILGIMHGALSEANESSTIINTMIWSNPVLSFFLPPPYNPLFIALSNSYFNVYAVDSTERIAYLGWIAIALSLFAIIKMASKKKLRELSTWIVIGIIFAWFSLGPYLQMGALSQTPSTTLPGIYLLYMNIPILNLVREPARFDLIVTLCMAILAGFGFKEIVESIKTKAVTENKQILYLITIFVTALILVECCGIPSNSAYIHSYFLSLSMPKSYYQLAKVPGNFSVMLLPTLSSYTNRPNLYTGESMYYQTAFMKPILGGYVGRENSTQEYSRLNIPLSIAAASLQAGGLFTYTSPIKENYTNVTLYFLSKYNTGAISVINQAFNATDVFILNAYLDSVFGSPTYSDNATSIWLVGNTVQKADNRSVVAYISQGNWTLGCLGLGMTFCNSSQNTLWYGPNLRAINVSVPKNRTKLLMSFSAASLNDNVTLYLFLTSDKHELGAARLSHNIVNYQLNLSLNPGTSVLFFVAPNITNATVNQVFDFGINNITFQPR